LCASANPVTMPTTSSAMLDGISSTSATIGPSFSVAIEKRSSVSRLPVRSIELTSTRNRIQTNARKMRVIALQPVEGGGRFFAADELDEHLFERAVSVHARAHLLDRSLRDDAAVGDDADVRREPLDDLENVRREEHRAAAADERMQQLLDLARRDRVDALERLVDEEQGRRREERRRRPQVLLHPVREVGNERGRRPHEIHQRQQVGRARLERLGGHAVHLSDEAERFGGGEPVEQREILRHDAHPPLDLHRRRRGVEPEDAHVARRGTQQPGEALDGRRLAGAVGAEKAVEAARRHAQIDAVDRALRAERPHQPVSVHREFHAGELYVSMRRMNRLARERSPYLLQHAANPVDWYPWGDEAFDKARREDKPIFLSIGYSTCHWCHVMEHESFENPEIADALNASFVSIKVDREERPGVDRVYMAFVQSTTGSGGWPMSVFLTPGLKPFFGGTYFPPASKWGRPGFIDLLGELSRVWTHDRARVDFAAAELFDRLKAVAGA